MSPRLSLPPNNQKMLGPEGKPVLTWADWFLRTQSSADTSAPVDARYIVTKANTDLTNETNLGVLSAGYLHMTSALGVASIASAFAVVAQSSPANPTGTADTGGKMMGLAGAITPLVTGRVLITITGTIFNPTAIADGANVQMRTGTGSAPANGDALAGTTAGGLVKYVAATVAEKAPFALSAIVSGLTLSTAIWIDVGLAAVTGGTATISDLSIAAVEV